MSFLTAEKKDHVARCPARGGKTYLGNALLKLFFSVRMSSLNTMRAVVTIVSEKVKQICHQRCRPLTPTGLPVFNQVSKLSLISKHSFLMKNVKYLSANVGSRTNCENINDQ